MEEKAGEKKKRLQCCCKHFPRDQGYYPSLFDKQSIKIIHMQNLPSQRAHSIATVLGENWVETKGKKGKDFRPLTKRNGKHALCSELIYLYFLEKVIAS